MDQYQRLQKVYWSWKDIFQKQYTYRLVLYHINIDDKSLKFKFVDCRTKYKKDRTNLDTVTKDFITEIKERTVFQQITIEYEKGACCG